MKNAGPEDHCSREATTLIAEVLAGGFVDFPVSVHNGSIQKSDEKTPIGHGHKSRKAKKPKNLVVPCMVGVALASIIGSSATLVTSMVHGSGVRSELAALRREFQSTHINTPDDSVFPPIPADAAVILASLDDRRIRSSSLGFRGSDAVMFEGADVPAMLQSVPRPVRHSPGVSGMSLAYIDPLPEPVPQIDLKRFVTKSSEDEVGARYFIYQDDPRASDFLPNGWLPDGDGISQNTADTDSPHSQPHCLRVGGQLSAKPFVGVYFLLDGKWEPQRSVDLFEKLGAEQGDAIVCRFWARSTDHAQVQFKVGGVTKGQVKDSLNFPVSSPWVKLSPDWRRYEIDLTGKDLSSLVGAFVWVCDRAHNDDRDVGFDLDDIYFVKVKNRKAD